MSANYAAWKNRPKETREERDKRELAQIEREEKAAEKRRKAQMGVARSGKNRLPPVGPGAYGTNKYRRPPVGEGEWLSTKGRRAIRKTYEDLPDANAAGELLNYRLRKRKLTHKQEIHIAERVIYDKIEREAFDREMKKYQTQRMNKEARRETRGFSGQRGRTALTDFRPLKKKEPGKTILGSGLGGGPSSNIRQLLAGA